MLISTFFISIIIPIDQLTRSILSLILIIILPYFVGFFLIYVYKEKLFESLFSRFWIIFLFIWIIGVIFLTVIMLALQLLHLSIVISVFPILILVFPLGYIILRIKETGTSQGLIIIFRNSFSLIQTTLMYVWPVLLMIVAVFAFGLIRLHIPFGTIGTAWDIPLAVNQPILRMLKDGYFNLNVRWVELILLYPPVVLWNISPLEITWSASLTLAAIFIIGLFLLAKEFFKSNLVAITAAVSGILLNIGHHVLYTQLLLDFRSNSICGATFPSILLFTYMKVSYEKYSINRWIKSILFPSIISVFLFFIKNSDLLSENNLGLEWGVRTFYIMPILIIIIGIISIILLFFVNHVKLDAISFLLVFLFLFIAAPQEGVMFTFIIVLFSLVYVIAENIENYKFFLRILSILSFFLILLASTNFLNIIFYNIISYLKLPWVTSLSFQELKNIFYEANGLSALLLTSIGVAITFFSGKKNQLIVLFLFVFTLFLYFSMILPQSQRAARLLTPFMALVIGLAAEKIINALTSREKYLQKIFILSIILFLLISSLSIRVENRFSKFPNGQKAYSIWSPEEYATASWFLNSTGTNVGIVSDYNTMVAMNSLANKVWLIGGDFISDGLPKKETQILKGIKNQVFGYLNASEAYHFITSLNQTQSKYEDMYLTYTKTQVNQDKIDFYVVLSYRTVNWIEQYDLTDVTWQGYTYNPNYPYKLFVDRVYVEPFLNSEHFSLVFNMGQKIYVFKLIR